MDESILKENALKSGFFSYACGVAAYLSEDYKIGGIEIVITKSTLPIKKGLSSSAAICILVARAFNELYKLNLSTNGEMNVAYRGELLTSSRCGRLDQACAYGIRPVCMEFNGDQISVEKLKVGKDLYWVFADLKSHKNTKVILTALNKCYPFAQNKLEKSVHDALGIDNHRIILEAMDAIAAGDAKNVGEIMKKAQKLFDEKIAPACPSELVAPKLHKILQDEKIKELSYGGKGVGSQGDGTIQFIAKNKDSQKKLVEYLNNELQLEAYPFTLPSRERVKKAIIPVAGFGTRMYPTTRFIKKSFLPVADENGVIKPVILYLLEELDQAGIEEIILIVGEDEEQEFKDVFKNYLSQEHVLKLPDKAKEYEALIRRVSGKIKFAVQRERKGFGHAVYQAREFLNREPVLLLLGDFIYKSNLSTSCVSQTINAYIKSGGQLTVSIKPVELEKVVNYGIITGEFDNKRNYLMQVSEMCEKPSVSYASDYLGVKVGNKDKYFATFGQYVLTPDVFDYLENEIAQAEKNECSEEISLTNVLQSICQTKGMAAVLVDGESYDVGIPSEYIKTFENFRKK